MSLFKSFLPNLSGGGPIANNLISYATASTGQLLNEGYAKVQTTLGSAGNFLGLANGLPSFASLGSVSGALGNYSNEGRNFLSSVAAGNLTDPSGTATDINAATGSDGSSTTSHKVMLTARNRDGATAVIHADANFPFEVLSEHRVEFDIMPEINEVRAVEYEPLSPPHMPGEFQKYKGTKSVQWQITGMFTARTRGEAKRNYIFMNNLRGWTMPYFGEKQRIQFAGKLGAPPPVLDFSGWRGLVGSVPVVIISLNWSWPKDCDWIPTGVVDPVSKQEIPFPTVMTVNIQIVESFSAEQFNGFDLAAFRNGRMVNAFLKAESGAARISRSEAIGGQQGITNGTASADYSNEGRNEARYPDDNDSQIVGTVGSSAADNGAPSQSEITAAVPETPAPTTPGASAPGGSRLAAINKEIASLEAARKEYNSIITNPSTSVQTRTTISAAEVAVSSKIAALQAERGQLTLII